MDLSTGSTAPFTAVDASQPHMVFSVPILFITKLRCAESSTITFATIRSGPVPGTSSRPDKSASAARHNI